MDGDRLPKVKRIILPERIVISGENRQIDAWFRVYDGLNAILALNEKAELFHGLVEFLAGYPVRFFDVNHRNEF